MSRLLSRCASFVCRRAHRISQVNSRSDSYNTEADRNKSELHQHKGVEKLKLELAPERRTGVDQT